MALTKVTRGGITADAVDGTKIADDAVDSEHYAATSVDNAHINDLAASKLTGTIATARLGSGTASSSTILYGDQTYKTEPAGFDPDAAVVFNDSGADVDFRVEGSGVANALFVQGSDGAVGVGTGSPGYALDVEFPSHGGARIKSSGSNTDSRLYLGTTGTTGSSSINFGDDANDTMGQIRYNHNGNTLEFKTDAAERMRIESSGRPRFNSNATPAVIDANSSFEFLYTSGGSKHGMTIACSDNANGAGMLNFYRSTTTHIGAINRVSSGDSVAYSTSSDYRLKENESEIDDGITRIKQLKPYKFNWKSDATNTEQDGFFAHEVESVVPHAIVGEKDAVKTLDKVVVNNEDDIIAFDIEEADWTAGKSSTLNEKGETVDAIYSLDTTWEASKEQIVPQAMDYGLITPLLAAGLKEAIAKIEALESENIDIKARLTALEA